MPTKGKRGRGARQGDHPYGLKQLFVSLQKARTLCWRSAGLTGQVSRLLNDAAEIAIADGSERITVEFLEEAARVAFA
jgi:hypothetical protein